MIRAWFSALTMAVALAASAIAQGPQAQSPRATLTLVPGWHEADGVRMAGLTVRLTPGWRTYWRMPGESGVAPSFDWSESENLGAVEVLWPSPEAFSSYGMTSLGYGGEVTLPLRVRAEDPTLPVRLRLSLFYGVCADICVPEEAELQLDIPPLAAGNETEIRAALAALPRRPAEVGARVERCTLAGAGEARRFEGVFAVPAASPDWVAVVEGPPEAWFEPAELRVVNGLVHVAAPLSPYGAPAWIDRAALRVTLIGPEGAVEVVGCAD